MLCSISTGKSGSNWLDRLRSSKGFPAVDHLDLEQFLNHHSPNISNSSDIQLAHSPTNKVYPKSNTNSAQLDKRPALDGNQTTEIPYGNGEREWFGVMSNVLSELFNMGDTNDFSRINVKKSSRKQRNPKICVLPTPPNVDDMRARDEGVLAALPLSFVNSRETKKMSSRFKLTVQKDVDVGSVGGEEEEEKAHADLSAFSRTEVTVIDTSFPSWKFEKMLFRRKNVWKVRDKKCKTMSANRKKRKASLLNEIAGEEKHCSPSKDANGEKGIIPSKEAHDQGNEMEEACKKIPVQQMRFRRKLKKGGSSVVLIKSIPTSKKNVASITKSCEKPIQRQHKA